MIRRALDMPEVKEILYNIYVKNWGAEIVSHVSPPFSVGKCKCPVTRMPPHTTVERVTFFTKFMAKIMNLKHRYKRRRIREKAIRLAQSKI